MNKIEKMKKTAGALRSKYGSDAAHDFEVSVMQYQHSGRVSDKCSQESLCRI